MVNAFDAFLLKRISATLTTKRIVWIIAPWDSFEDELLACIAQISDKPYTWTRIDCLAYCGITPTLNNVKNIEGFTLRELCSLSKSSPNNVILFDNIPNESPNAQKPPIEEVLAICGFIHNINPEAQIVLRSRALPDATPMQPFIIRPLDEPDCNRFILAHPLSKYVPQSGLASDELYRMSGGLPGIINQILNKLKHENLNDLVNENSYSSLHNIDLSRIPSSLIDTVDQLRKTHQNNLFEILQCLAMFPHGEDISHLRNFKSKQPFFPLQSRQLVAMGLVSAVTHGFFAREDAELPKVINEIRPAQDYVRSLLVDEYEELTYSAIALYFGKDWRLGPDNYKLGPSFSLQKLNEFEYATLNASNILRRFFNDTLASGRPRDLQDSLGLLSFYTSKLDSFCLYRDICNLCYIIAPSIKILINNRLAQDIMFRYANALRMFDNFDEALDIYNYLLLSKNQSRNRTARILLHISMIHDEQNEKGKAVHYAKEAKNLSDKNATFFHAETIIYCNSKAANVLEKLTRLNRSCTRNEHHATANTIEIRIAFRFEDRPRRQERLLQMAQRALKQKDIYNYVRSVIFYCGLALESDTPIPNNIYNSLLTCYDYVRSQRIMYLFQLANSYLWKIIEMRPDHSSLAPLFVLSSVTFRLDQDEDNEKYFLIKLIRSRGWSSGNVSPEHRAYIQRRAFHLELDKEEHQMIPSIVG